MSQSSTTLLELDSYTTSHRRLFAKFEFLGPTGSIKDRMVHRVLDLAVGAGELKPGMEIVEASSGNTGTALARAGSERGYRVKIFVAASVSPEKINSIQGYGATIEKIDVQGGRISEIACAEEYAKRHKAYFFNQFSNSHHIRAYKETLVVEILNELASIGVKIDVLVGGVGSGATLRAVGETLREQHNRALKIIAVMPSQYPSDIEGLNPGQIRQQGHFKIWLDRASGFENENRYIRDEDAYRAMFDLERDVGFSVGPASAACLFVARDIVMEGNVLFLLTDSGSKYLQKASEWRKRLKTS